MDDPGDDSTRKRGKEPQTEALSSDSPATPVGKKPAVATVKPPPAPTFTASTSPLLSKQSERTDTKTLTNEFGITEYTGPPPATPDHHQLPSVLPGMPPFDFETYTSTISQPPPDMPQPPPPAPHLLPIGQQPTTITGEMDVDKMKVSLEKVVQESTLGRKIEDAIVINIRFIKEDDNSWPQMRVDDVCNSVAAVCRKHTLSMKTFNISESGRQSFDVILDTVTATSFIDAGMITIYSSEETGAQEDNECDFHIFPTDERCKPIGIEQYTPSKKNNTEEQERRKALLIPIYFQIPTEVMYYEEGARIHSLVDETIMSNIQAALDPKYPAQSINLIDSVTQQGRRHNSKTAYVILHNAYHDCDARYLSDSTTLQKIKYITVPDLNDFITARIPRRVVEDWDLVQCCFRAEPSDAFQDGDTINVCPGGLDDTGKHKPCRFLSEFRSAFNSSRPGPSSSTGDPLFNDDDRPSVAKKKQKISGQQAKAAQSASKMEAIQSEVCPKWAKGECRAKMCLKNHAFDLYTPECMSSAQRNTPKRCRIPAELCPYANHQDLQ